MYTYEQRVKVVELYIEYGHHATAMSRELVYTHSNFLVHWYKEYIEEEISSVATRGAINIWRNKSIRTVMRYHKKLREGLQHEIYRL